MPLRKTFRSIFHLRIIYLSITIFLVILSFFVFRQVQYLVDTSRLVNHTTKVSLELEKLIGTVKDAETGHRGYLITHDSAFLLYFFEALKQYPEHLNRLRELTIDNKEQQKYLNEISRVSKAKELHMAKILAIDKVRIPSTPEMLYGKSIMDRLRAQIKLMNEVENKLLLARSELFNRQSFFTPLFLLTISLSALAILFFSYNKLNTQFIHSLSMQKDQQVLVQEAPAFICSLKGPFHVYKFANEEYMRMVGKREILGKTFREALPELEGQGFYELLDEVYKTGKPFVGRELPVKIESGNGILREFYVSFEYRPSLSAKAAIEGVLVYGLDVTEQVVARQKIEEREEQLRIALDGGELGTFDFDGQTNTLVWSTKAKELFDLPAGAAIDYDTFLKRIHPEDREKSSEIFQGFLVSQNTSVYELEYRIIQNSEEQVRWVRSKGKATFDADGKLKRIVGVMQDITQRKEAEIALKNVTSRLLQTFNMMPESVFLIDAKGKLIHVNENAAKVFGDYTPEQLLSSGDVNILIKKANDLFDRYDENGEIFYGQYAAMTSAFTTGLPSKTIVKHINKKTNEETWWLIHTSPFTNEQGEVIQVLATSIDITAQKAAEAILKESEERFRKLVMDLPAAVYSCDAQGRITFYNDRAVKMWGRMPAIGQDLWSAYWKIFTPDGSPLPLDRCPMAIALKEGRSIIGEEIVVERPDGTRAIVLAHPQPQFGLSGEITGAIDTLIDVTEQVTALRSLTESEERYHNLIYTSPSAIGVLKGEDLVITTANDAIIEIWGKGRDIIGKKYFEALPELAEQGYREVFNEVYKTGKPFNAVETPVRIFQHGKTELKYYNFLLYPQQTAQGVIDGIGIIATEVTEQAVVNKKIQESEGRFRLLAEALPQLVWVTNAQGINEYTSHRWEEYTGVKPLGLAEWVAIVHPYDIDSINNAWMHCLSTEEIYKHEVRLKSKAGEYRWFVVNGEPVRDEENKITKWVGAFTDIHTEKSFANQLEKQVEERTHELAVKNTDLEKVNKELEAFNYISSHDLQEPLRKIQTFSSRILQQENDVLSETGKDYFKRMQGAAQRMQRLIEDLLAFSRASSGERKFEKVPLDSIVEEVKIELKDIIDDKRAVIEVGELCQVNIIPFQFRQLLHNLLSNALKFTKADIPPHIVIESEKIVLRKEVEGNPVLNNPSTRLRTSGKAYCHIRLQDNGIGFDPQYSERIFEVFQRLHREKEYTGTGIGLAIVKKIVENHGGFITAHGEANKGATFDIYIPSQTDLNTNGKSTPSSKNLS